MLNQVSLLCHRKVHRRLDIFQGSDLVCGQVESKICKEFGGSMVILKASSLPTQDSSYCEMWCSRSFTLTMSRFKLAAIREDIVCAKVIPRYGIPCELHLKGNFCCRFCLIATLRPRSRIRDLE